jgi:CelD/BcsL family acetyltransferase involved in cellulose biosynthesis
MTVEFLSPRGLSNRDVAAWNNLAERAVEPNPFFEPQFVLPAVEGFDDRSEVRLLTVRQGPELQFLAPLTKNRFWGHPRLLTTWNHTILYLHTPLIDADPSTGIEAWRLALRAMRRSAWRASITSIPADGPALAMLRLACDEGREWVIDDLQERAFVQRRDSFADYAQHMSGRHRRELERRSRKLAAATGGPATTVDMTDAGGVEAFLRLEVEGWKGKAGSAVGSKRAVQQVFEAMGRNFREEGRLLVLGLRTQQDVAAAIVCVRGRSTLYMIKMAYDESLREYSPGVRLIDDLVAHFYAETELTGIDSCADPRNPFINRLFPDRRPIAKLAVRSSRPAARPVVDVTHSTTRALRRAVTR